MSPALASTNAAVAVPDPSVSVRVSVMSLAAKPVTASLNRIPTSKVPVCGIVSPCSSVGRVISTVGIPVAVMLTSIVSENSPSEAVTVTL